jgi:hypothetical protein
MRFSWRNEDTESRGRSRSTAYYLLYCVEDCLATTEGRRKKDEQEGSRAEGERTGKRRLRRQTVDVTLICHTPLLIVHIYANNEDSR